MTDKQFFWQIKEKIAVKLSNILFIFLQKIILPE